MNLSHGRSLLATTAGGGDLTLPVIVVLVVVGLWLLSLLVYPYTACSGCKGDPKFTGGLTGRSFRLCSRCGGSGRRMRFMAGVWPTNRDE